MERQFGFYSRKRSLHRSFSGLVIINNRSYDLLSTYCVPSAQLDSLHLMLILQDKHVNVITSLKTREWFRDV